MKRQRTLWLILAFAVIFSGCGSSVPAAPAEGESAVIEVETAAETIETADENYYDNNESLTSEETVDEISESTSEEKEEEPEFLLSDGPIFCNCEDKFNGIYSFWLYSMKTGERKEVFRYNSSIISTIIYYCKSADTSSFSYGYRYNPDYEMSFDSGLQRMTVLGQELANGEHPGKHHVGYVDRNGNITDITNMVHSATSDFSSVVPNDLAPCFTSDDKLMFYDCNDDSVCLFDIDNKKIIDSYAIEYGKDDHSFMDVGPDGKYIDRYFEANGNKYNVEGAIDYVKNGDDYIFLGILENHIVHYGPSVSVPHEGYFTSTGAPFGNYADECTVNITPDSDYQIEQLAYSNGVIAFTAKRGNDRALFKMSYVDGVAGEPELVEKLDDTWGEMIFWKDEDVPYFEGQGQTDQGSDDNVNSDTDSQNYQVMKNFKIEGTWRNIGTGTYGQMQNNAAVVFNGTNCNVYSPADTYAFYQDGDSYVLNCTSPLGETMVFSVGIVDKNRIDIIKGNTIVELERVK